MEHIEHQLSICRLHISVIDQRKNIYDYFNYQTININTLQEIKEILIQISSQKHNIKVNTCWTFLEMNIHNLKMWKY